MKRYFQKLFSGVLVYFLIIVANLYAQKRAVEPKADDILTVFTNVNVVPMDEERILKGQTVIITDGKIEQIGEAGKVKIPAGAFVVNGEGKYLIPGLSDMHTHIASNVDSIYTETLLLILASYGITTIRNCDYLPKSEKEPMMQKISGKRLLELRTKAENREIVSPRLYVSGNWYGMGRPDAGREPFTIPPDNISWRIKKYKEEGYDFIKLRNEPVPILDSVVTAARQLGITVMGHINKEYSLDKAFKAGYRSTEHLTGYIERIIFNGVYQTADTTGIITRMVDSTRDVKIWHCPTLIASERGVENIEPADIDLPEYRFIKEENKKMVKGWLAEKTDEKTLSDRANTLRFSYKIVRALHNAGIPLLSGSDAIGLTEPPGASLHCELQALVRAGLTPYEALLTSTRNVADYFNTREQTGTISIGKRADLVLLNANPLQDIKNTMDIAGVMVNGKWYSRHDFEKMFEARDYKIF